jgi:hypothetical protein
MKLFTETQDFTILKYFFSGYSWASYIRMSLRDVIDILFSNGWGSDLIRPLLAVQEDQKEANMKVDLFFFQNDLLQREWGWEEEAFSPLNTDVQIGGSSILPNGPLLKNRLYVRFPSVVGSLENDWSFDFNEHFVILSKTNERIFTQTLLYSPFSEHSEEKLQLVFTDVNRIFRAFPREIASSGNYSCCMFHNHLLLISRRNGILVRETPDFFLLRHEIILDAWSLNHNLYFHEDESWYLVPHVTESGKSLFGTLGGSGIVSYRWVYCITPMLDASSGKLVGFLSFNEIKCGHAIRIYHPTPSHRDWRWFTSPQACLFCECAKMRKVVNKIYLRPWRAIAQENKLWIFVLGEKELLVFTMGIKSLSCVCQLWSYHFTFPVRPFLPWKIVTRNPNVEIFLICDCIYVFTLSQLKRQPELDFHIQVAGATSPFQPLSISLSSVWVENHPTLRQKCERILSFPKELHISLSFCHTFARSFEPFVFDFHAIKIDENLSQWLALALEFKVNFLVCILLRKVRVWIRHIVKKFTKSAFDIVLPILTVCHFYNKVDLWTEIVNILLKAMTSYPLYLNLTASSHFRCCFHAHPNLLKHFLFYEEKKIREAGKIPSLLKVIRCSPLFDSKVNIRSVGAKKPRNRQVYSRELTWGSTHQDYRFERSGELKECKRIMHLIEKEWSLKNLLLLPTCLS